MALSTSDVEADNGKAFFFNHSSYFGIKLQRFNEDDYIRDYEDILKIEK